MYPHSYLRSRSNLAWRHRLQLLITKVCFKFACVASRQTSRTLMLEFAEGAASPLGYLTVGMGRGRWMRVNEF